MNLIKTFKYLIYVIIITISVTISITIISCKHEKKVDSNINIPVVIRKQSSFLVSYVDQVSNRCEGWDSTRAKMIRTKNDWIIEKAIMLNFESSDYNVTEKDSIKLTYSYVGEDTLEVKALYIENLKKPE